MAGPLAWVVLGVALSLQAQIPASVSVSGRVVAGPENDRRAVVGATISSGPVQTTSARDGGFTLLLPLGTSRLSIEAAGFVAQSIPLTISTGMPPLEIVLVENAAFRDEVTVSAAAEPSKDPAGVTVSPAAVLSVAGGADNIFRALQTLPGVSAADDFGSRLTVRGGGPDQNLTVMDGIEIHNPYRLFGLTSAFNPETIDSFELTAGGFGVAHGDRLSSILVVNNRAGTTREAFAGSVSSSLTDANIVLEGRVPKTALSSWLFTARRTYYDLIAERIVDTNLPSFTDIQFKAAIEPRVGHKLTFFGLRSREHTDLSIGGDNDDDHLGDRAVNDLAAVTYEAALGPRVSSRTIAAWYRYMDTLDVDASYLNPAQRSNTPNGFARTVVSFTRDLTVYDRSLRQEIRITAGPRHVLDTGGELHLLRTAWGWTIDGDRNTTVANGTSVLGGFALPSLLRSTRDTARAGLWFQDRMQLTSRLRLEPGIRFDRSGLDGEAVFSPRFSARMELTPATAVRGSIGLFTQSPGYEKLLQADNFVDLTDTVARNLQAERSVHLVGALEHRFGPGVLGRVEGYVKTYDRLIIGRLETPQETAARVAQYNFPASLAANVPRDPQITAVPVNGASGRAHGFDVYLERRSQTGRDRVRGWASYTWGRAEIEAYGQRYPFDYDRRHAASFVGTFGAASRIDLSATMRVASGFARTSPVGVRVAPRRINGGAPGATNTLVPARDGDGNLMWTLDFGDAGNINRDRLPMYARLDVRVTFKPRSANGRWLFYLEVLNALDRRNVSQLQPELLYNPAGDRPAIGFASDTGLPRLPSFGFRYHF